MKTSILAFAVTASVVLGAGSALAQDVDAGKNEFKKCLACHAVGEGAKNKVGPVLNNVFGRVAGTAEGFKYSQAMIDKGAEGLVWDHDSLAEFLHKPKDFVPGTKMTFAGIADAEAVDNLLAYLLTFSPDYEPPAATE